MRSYLLSALGCFTLQDGSKQARQAETAGLASSLGYEPCFLTTEKIEKLYLAKSDPKRINCSLN